MNRKKHSVDLTGKGNYELLVKKVQNTFGVKKEDSYDPLNVTKIIVADDNAMCNSTLRILIEKLGNYQVHSSFNGVDVIIL